MICDELAELYELYALGVLEPDEQARIKDHLATDCQRCEAALRRAVALNAMVFATAPQVQPPERVRQRILKLVAPPTARTSSWTATPIWIGLAAALACVALWLGIERQRKAAEAERLTSELRSEQSERQRLEGAFAFLRDPETRPASASPGANQPRGTYFVNPRSGVMLIASNLPQVDASKTYQMWVIPKGQSPRPAGLFRPDSNGGAVHLRPGAVDINAGDAIAISVEPESGSTAPTTTPLLVTPVQGS